MRLELSLAGIKLGLTAIGLFMLLVVLVYLPDHIDVYVCIPPTIYLGILVSVGLLGFILSVLAFLIDSED